MFDPISPGESQFTEQLESLFPQSEKGGRAMLDDIIQEAIETYFNMQKEVVKPNASVMANAIAIAIRAKSVSGILKPYYSGASMEAFIIPLKSDG